MKIHTIEQKMTGTGSIHDIASDQYDREIKFRKGTKYAVVLSSYYGDSYTTHCTDDATLRAAKSAGDYSFEIIDPEGNTYISDIFNWELVRA